MSRIIIVDPDFEHGGGHNLTANSIIAANVAGEVIVAAPATLPLQVQVSEALIRRIFPCNSYAATNPRRTLLERLRSMVRSLFPKMRDAADVSPASQYRKVLQNFWEEIDAKCSDSVVVHTGSEVLLAALLDTIDALPTARQPILHYRQVRPVSRLETAQKLHARLAQRVRQNQAFIYSETEAFKDTLVNLGHDASKIEFLELIDCSRPLERQRAPVDFVTVAVLGTVRLEKGHARLVSIAHEYEQLAGGRHAPRLRYLIHASHLKNRKLFDRMQKSLNAAKILYEMADIGPGDDIHWRCLADCHVVLIPYDAAQYRNRGSGIAIDAIISARPLLITGACTLEEYVRLKNGLVAVTDREFAHSLLEIVSEYDSYSDNAMELAIRMKAVDADHPFYARLGRSH